MPCFDEMRDNNNNLCVICNEKLPEAPYIIENTTLYKAEDPNYHEMEHNMYVYKELKTRRDSFASILSVRLSNLFVHKKMHDVLVANIKYAAPNNQEQLLKNVHYFYKNYGINIDMIETHIIRIERAIARLRQNMKRGIFAIDELTQKTYDYVIQEEDVLKEGMELYPIMNRPGELELCSAEEIKKDAIERLNKYNAQQKYSHWIYDIFDNKHISHTYIPDDKYKEYVTYVYVDASGYKEIFKISKNAYPIDIKLNKNVIVMKYIIYDIYNSYYTQVYNKKTEKTTVLDYNYRNKDLPERYEDLDKYIQE